MGGVVSGGASAQSSKGSSQETNTLDPQFLEFRQKLFGQSGNLLDGIINGGAGRSTFIAPESADTNAFYESVRNLNPTGQNSSQINSVLSNLMGGNFDVGPTQGSYLGDPRLATSQGYDSVAANATGMDAATYGSTGYNPTGYDAAITGPLSGTGTVSGFEASNPYRDQALTDVVNPTLNEFDTQSARTMNARRAARDAGSAFGSRAAVSDAVYQGESDRSRSLLQSGLLKDAFNLSTGYGFQDAGARNAALSQDSSQAFQQGEANAGRIQGARADNAGAANQAAAFGAGASNAAAAGSAANVQAARSQNAGAANQFAMDNAQRQDAARAAAASAANLISGQNADRFNAFATTNSNIANDLAKFNTGTTQQNLQQRLQGVSGAQGQDQNSFQNLMATLGLKGQSGAQQDNYNTGVAREPLDLLGTLAGIVSGTPYTTNSTSKQKSSGKGATAGAG